MATVGCLMNSPTPDAYLKTEKIKKKAAASLSTLPLPPSAPDRVKAKNAMDAGDSKCPYPQDPD